MIMISDPDAIKSDGLEFSIDDCRIEFLLGILNELGHNLNSVDPFSGSFCRAIFSSKFCSVSIRLISVIAIKMANNSNCLA